MSTEDALRAKGEMSERLKSLNQDEAFQYLKTVIEKKRDSIVEALARAILAGGEVDPVKLARTQGFYEGAMHVLNRPENAEAAFHKALKRLEEDTSE
jgi:glycine cleavage system regulatory protein